VALGGGGIAAREAAAGLPDKVAWSVFATGRGAREKHPSLCDFVAGFDPACPLLTLVRGKDPAGSDAFSK
jgi:hypothetical protein